MAFIKNSYGEISCFFGATPKCVMCLKNEITKYYSTLEEAVACLEQNNVCMECLFDDEKKNKPSGKGKKK